MCGLQYSEVCCIFAENITEEDINEEKQFKWK